MSSMELGRGPLGAVVRGETGDVRIWAGRAPWWWWEADVLFHEKPVGDFKPGSKMIWFILLKTIRTLVETFSAALTRNPNWEWGCLVRKSYYWHNERALGGVSWVGSSRGPKMAWSVQALPYLPCSPQPVAVWHSFRCCIGAWGGTLLCLSCGNKEASPKALMPWFPLSFHFDLPRVDLTETDLPENMFFSSSPFIVTPFPHCRRKPMSHLSLISLWKTALL